MPESWLDVLDALKDRAKTAYDHPDQRPALTDAALAELNAMDDPENPGTPIMEALAGSDLSFRWAWSGTSSWRALFAPLRTVGSAVIGTATSFLAAASAPGTLFPDPRSQDSVSRTIWETIRRGDWKAALDRVEEAKDFFPSQRALDAFRGAVKRMEGLDKWRKQFSKAPMRRIRQELKSLEKTLEDHLKKPYRAGVDDAETWRIRYQIDYLKRLLGI